MDLSFDHSITADYHSGSQIARILCTPLSEITLTGEIEQLFRLD